MEPENVIQITCPFDAHVHLRQPGKLLELAITHITAGGVQSVYVMPNTVPPLTNVDMALEYLDTLEKWQPNVQFFVSLYLSPSLTADEVRKAKACGITGIKSYPRGVTTNSSEGVESFENYYEVFKAMEEVDLILNLHGEQPSTQTGNTCVWNAEAKFLPQLHQLHRRFPRLRIILEHATTHAAVLAVKACGPTVACTITAHHLSLTVDDWAGNGFNYCKPVAKSPEDREALREVIREGHPRFFLGSDSAPHPLEKKVQKEPTDCCAAGIYTSGYLLPTLAATFESAVPPLLAGEEQEGRKRTILSPIPLDKLPDFASNFGRAFYQLPPPPHPLITTLVKTPNALIPSSFTHHNYPSSADLNPTPLTVIPFWPARNIGWKIESMKSTSSIP